MNPAAAYFLLPSLVLITKYASGTLKSTSNSNTRELFFSLAPGGVVIVAMETGWNESDPSIVCSNNLRLESIGRYVPVSNATISMHSVMCVKGEKTKMV